MMEHLDGRRWRKSSYSANGGTDGVEVGLDRGAEGVLVRDTKARSGPVLWFSPEAWTTFAGQLKATLAPCRFPVNGSSSLASFPPGFRLEDSLGG